METAATGVLNGIRVLDFTQIQFGPTCTQILGDFGADVIKIERVSTGEFFRRIAFYWRGQPIPMLALNRNKRCIALDTRTDAGKQIVYKLAQTADVVVHNFRPGVMDRMGFGYSVLKRINPQIILANGSGFGETGPYAHRPGQDKVAQAMSGIMFRTVNPGEPPVFPATPLADFTGGLLMAQGVLLALLARERRGTGQEVNVSLLDASLALMPQEATVTLITGEDILGTRRTHPLNGVFQTKDGYLVMMGTFAPQPVHDVCTAIGLPDLSEDPRFASPQAISENAADLATMVKARFLEKTSQEWLQILDSHDIVSGEAQTLEQALTHPQVVQNEMIWEMNYEPLGKIRVLGQPVKLTVTPARVHRPPPLLGEHTDEILAEVGYGPEEIARLRAEKAVA